MWSQFFIAFAACAAILFAPGYLAARTVNLTRPLALAAAPAISCGFLEIWAYLAWKAGIFATGAIIFLPVLALCAAAFAAGALVRRRTGKMAERAGEACLPEAPIRRKALAAFLIVGVAVTGLMLVKSLDGPDSFIQSYDNMSHLMRIKAFVETGVFSPIGVDMDCSLPDPPFGDHTSGFYPSAWHCIAAILVSILGIPIAIAENVVNCTFIALVFPVSAWAFCQVTFKERKVLGACALLTLAFATFPWRMLTWGPLYPNMAAYAMVLGVAACFIALFEQGLKVQQRIALALVMLACIAGLGLTHPNSVFMAGILLAPFICWKIMGIGEPSGKLARKSKVRWAIMALFLLVAIALWFALLNSSFMHAIVHFTWPASATLREATHNLLTLALHMTPAQPALALLVIMGALRTFKERRNLWITGALAITCIMYLANTTTDGTLKTILTGFWYQDPCRISGMLVIFAYPLAGLGLYTVLEALRKGADRLSKARWPKAGILASGSVCLILLGMIYAPNHHDPIRGDVETGLGEQRWLICHLNNVSRDDDYLGADERAFLEMVKQVVPEDAVIINHPYDGSAYAAAPMDLNLYWCYWGGYHKNTDDENSWLIRHRLYKVATDEQVQDAVKAAGGEYLLLLDQGTVTTKENLTWIPSYRAIDWYGIEAINDDTPGLEPVLSEGDLRLYRITAVDDK